jgi:SAM-dependent methyltransferase
MSGAPALTELERAGWDARAETYGRITGRITARIVAPLLDAAGVAEGMRVLDLGTGPGYAAAAAAARGAEATGVDIAAEVLARAGARHREVRFVCADAEALPFADGAFDAVVGNFAVNHVPRPERAAAQMARVTARGGAVALSTWDAGSGFPGLLTDALANAGVRGADRFRFADDDRFAALLRGAGFAGVEVRAVALTHRIADANELWEGMLGGSVRSAALLSEQSAGAQAAVRTEFERLAEEHRDAGGGLAIPIRVKIARGARP